MKCLELFSGTGSVGAVCKEYNIETISLDIEKRFNPTICIDIMKWDYTQYPPYYFDIITASPVCLWWSLLRGSWIGRKAEAIRPNTIITREILDEDINKYGKPMVDKTFEIIEYFKPKYYWIENPHASLMWKYIKEKYSHLNLFYNNYDYCKYSNWGYKKPTIFATNYRPTELPKKCRRDCENMLIYEKNGKIRKLHNRCVGGNKLEKQDRKELRNKKKDTNLGRVVLQDNRYRIPPLLIKTLLEETIKNNNI